jgi:hypothetical protein
MKRCIETQRMIAEGRLDDAARRHVGECPDCADFERFSSDALKTFSELSADESSSPPVALDILVKSHAEANAASAKSIPFYMRKPFVAVAVAASLMLVSALIFLTDEQIPEAPRGVPPSEGGRSAAEISGRIPGETPATEWEKIDLDDEYFALSADLLLCKELVHLSSMEEGEAEKVQEIEIPTEILI